MSLPTSMAAEAGRFAEKLQNESEEARELTAAKQVQTPLHQLSRSRLEIEQDERATQRAKRAEERVSAKTLASCDKRKLAWNYDTASYDLVPDDGRKSPVFEEMEEERRRRQMSPTAKNAFAVKLLTEESPKRPSKLADNAKKYADSWDTNFEDYVAKVFAPAYDTFSSNADLQRLSTEAKFNSLSNTATTSSAFIRDLTRHAREEGLDLTEPLSSKYVPNYGAEDMGGEFAVYQRRTTPSVAVRDPYVTLTDCARPSDSDSSYTKYLDGLRQYGTKKPDRVESLLNRRGNHRSMDRQILIDGSSSSDCSAFTAARSDYTPIRTGDSYIMGSNFALVCHRQPDSWYAKVDKLLADVRNS